MEVVPYEKGLNLSLTDNIVCEGKLLYRVRFHDGEGLERERERERECESCACH